MTAITYKGRDRYGDARTGSTDESPASLIQRLFWQRWMSVVAERDGVEVGRIGWDVEERTHTWWAES